MTNTDDLTLPRGVTLPAGHEIKDIDRTERTLVVTISSAARDSSMWPISDSSVSENSALWTGLPLSAASDRGVTNWAPPAVSTQRTPAARSRRRRISSRAL